MARQDIKTPTRRWWLNPPVLSAAFVLFMALAAISGALGTREQRSSGNDYWSVFLERPTADLGRLVTIGTWRRDRRHWEEPGPAHCGIKVYALPPAAPGFFTGPSPMRGPWSRGLPAELSATRMSPSFCGGSERLMTTLHERISRAWRDPANERFCEKLPRGGAVFAGVLDREGARAYTWFSAGPEGELAEDPSSAFGSMLPAAAAGPCGGGR